MGEKSHVPMWHIKYPRKNEFSKPENPREHSLMTHWDNIQNNYKVNF